MSDVSEYFYDWEVFTQYGDDRWELTLATVTLNGKTRKDFITAVIPRINPWWDPDKPDVRYFGWEDEIWIKFHTAGTENVSCTEFTENMKYLLDMIWENMRDGDNPNDDWPAQFQPPSPYGNIV